MKKLMKKLPVAKVLERRECYCESLEAWIEIAVFDEEYLALAIVAQLDLTDMELPAYRYEVLKKWPGIGAEARLKMSLDVAAQKEVYDLIVEANPSLHPRNIVQIERISDTLGHEHNAIEQWFLSRGKDGQRPEVIHGAEA